jgi:hypothetical protein
MKDESKNSTKYGAQAVQKTTGYFLKSYFTRFPLLIALFVVIFSFNGFSQLRPGVTLGYNHAIFGGPDARAWGFMDADPQFAPRFHIGGFHWQQREPST